MIIPKCVHPLSRFWDQPKNTDIDIYGTHAFMSDNSFKELHEYSCSIPTGVYAGKMWKAYNRNKDIWYLKWYEDDPEDKTMSLIKSRIIVII